MSSIYSHHAASAISLSGGHFPFGLDRRRPPGCAIMASMGHRIHSVVLPSEIGDFADEVRRVFVELGRVFGAESLAGECAPPVDVYETDDALEVVVDLPGASLTSVRLLAKRDTLLIAGD